MSNNCKSFNVTVKVDTNHGVAVDQSGHNKDFTAILFYKVNKNKIEILDFKIIPPRNDIEEYIKKLKDEMIEKTSISKIIVR